MKKIGVVFAAILFSACSGGGGGTSNKNVGTPSDTDASDNTVSEFAEIGSSAGITARAIDQDSGDIVSYTIVGDSLFSVNSSTGVVTVGGELDAETAESHTITVRASSSDGTQSSTIFTVQVTDENDNVPAFVGSSELTVPEGSTQAGSVAAQDLDVDSVLSFSLTGGPDQTLFSIDAESGTLAFLEASNFDAPTDVDVDNVYELTVSVSDSLNSVEQAYRITVQQNTPPEVTIVFPPSGLFPDNTITVRGTISDDDGDLVTVSVSGGGAAIEAVVTDNTWVAENVPLVSSTASVGLVATATDTVSLQSSASETKMLDISVPLVDTKYISLVGNDLYLATPLGSIVKENIVTGVREFVFRDGIRDGTDVQDGFSIVAMAVAENGEIFVVDDQSTIWSIVDGFTSLISGDDRGSGVSLTEEGRTVSEIVITSDSQSLFVFSENQEARLISIEITSGDRSLVSDSGRGNGPEFGATTVGITINAAGTVAYTNSTSANALFAIDISTGDRSIVSGGETPIGSGQSISFIQSIVLAESGNSVYATQAIGSAGSRHILEIDLSSGDRTIMATGNENIGFFDPTGIVFDEVDERLLVVDPSQSAVFSFDTGTLLLTKLTEYDVFPAFQLITPESIIFDESGLGLYVSDSNDTTGTLSLVPLSGATPTVISGRVAIGGDLGSIRDISLDTSRNRIIATHGIRNLVSIDLETGSHTGFTGQDFGSGAAYPSSSSSVITIDSATDTAYFSAGDYLFSTNMSNGFREVLLEFSPIDDSLLYRPNDFVFVDSLFVINQLGFNSVVSVDVTSSNVSLVSRNDQGAGDDFLVTEGIVDAGSLLYVIEAGRIFEVEKASGDRRIIERGGRDAPIGRGSRLYRMQEGILDETSEILYVIDTYTNSVSAVDVNSGDHVIIAK